MRKKGIHQKNTPIWESNSAGRSFFGWVIKEEIFGVFFILTLLSLLNDEKVIEKIGNNVYIQGFILLISIYLLYQRIPLSLAFLIIFIFMILFSDFFLNVKNSLRKISNKLFIKLPKKGILKKISFKDDKSSSSEEKKNSVNEKLRLGKSKFSCSDLEKMFDLDSDSDSDSSNTDVEKDSQFDPDSETDCDESQKLEETEDDLKEFMKDFINNEN